MFCPLKLKIIILVSYRCIYIIWVFFFIFLRVNSLESNQIILFTFRFFFFKITLLWRIFVFKNIGQAEWKFHRFYYRCKDFLKLYLDEQAAVNENSVHEYELCGDKSSLPQKTFYSRGRSIHLEFHTESVVISNPYKGFIGKYSFIDSS